MGCHFLLQGIFQTQGLNPGLLHCRRILYHQPPGKLHTKHEENYKGLKRTAGAAGANSGQDAKRPKSPTAISEELGATTVLCMLLIRSTTKGVGRPPKPSLWPNPCVLLHPHPLISSLPPLREPARTPVAYSCSSLLQHKSQ